MKILNFSSLFTERNFFVDSMNFSEANISITNSEIYAGGKGVNLSVALSRAGAKKVYNAGLVGNDGEIILNTLLENDINTLNIGTKKEQTAYFIVFRDKLGNKKRFSSATTNNLITTKFTDNVFKRFSQGDFVIVDDALSVSDYIISLAKKHGGIVFYYPESTPQNLKNINYLFLNFTQARIVTGFSDRESIVKFFKEKYPLLKVLINFNGNGCLYIDKAHNVFQPSYMMASSKQTFNFDTFIGYFIAGLTNSQKITEIMQFAAMAAAIKGETDFSFHSIPYSEQVYKVANSLKECESEENSRALGIKKRVDEYIENNIKTAKIKGLSEALGYSEVYTGELIKNTLGITFSQLLQQRRCELAAKMLLGTRFSVKEIINFVGYDNETFFRTKFKSFYGVSPNQYRKNGQIIDFKH